MIFAENASFRSYGVICLPQMPLTTTKPQNTYTNGIQAMQHEHDITIRAFRSYSTLVYLLRAYISNINMRTYVSGRVGTDAYN